MFGDLSSSARSCSATSIIRSSPNCPWSEFSASVSPSVYKKMMVWGEIHISCDVYFQSLITPRGMFESIVIVSTSLLISKGTLWPALQIRKRPVGRSSTPVNIVTNMFDSLWSANDSFICIITRSGAASRAESVLNKDLVTAITKAAGTPFPLTSPTQKKSFSSRI